MVYSAPVQRGVEVARRHFPAAAARLEAELPRLLQPLLTDTADPARWNTSLLTDGGYPFEFTCTTLNDSIRYTLEVAPARDNPAARLAQAVAVVEPLLGRSLAADPLLAVLQQVQAPGGLRYGAWVGVRHSATDSGYKIYAEVPLAGQATALAYLNPRLSRPVGVQGRAIVLQMIGWYPATGELEFYFRVEGLQPWELPALMQPQGLEANHKTVLEAVQAAYGRPMYQQLPGPVFGFSYTVPAAEAAPRMFSFYTFAETLFGADAHTHRKLARYFERSGADMGHYLELSQPTLTHQGRWMHHGMFGVTVGPGTPAIAHIGLRPRRPPAMNEALIAALRAQQSPGGAFLSQVRLRFGEVEDRNCFVSGLVLRELAGLPAHPDLDDARRQAYAFLLRSQYPQIYPYCYAFWPPQFPPFWLRQALYADADDTCVIGLELVRAGHWPADALRYIAETYLTQYRATGPLRRHCVHDWQPEGVFLTWFTTADVANPIDCCVNANVVALLAWAGLKDTPGYLEACAMINDAAARVARHPRRVHHFTPYYPHPAEWHHALQHAVAAGAHELQPALEALAELLEVAVPATPEAPPPLCSDVHGHITWTAPSLALARQLRREHTLTLL